MLLISAVVFTFPALLLTVSGDDYFKRAPGALGLEPGPTVLATQGGVWPKPRQQITLPGFMIVGAQNFQYEVISKDFFITNEFEVSYSLTMTITNTRKIK